MHILFTCPICLKQGLSPLGEALVPCMYRDDGLYEIKCSRGHISLGTFQAHLHQVLFEMGAFAILDGYYREATANFASSLERFFEFYIRVIAYSRKVQTQAIDECWKFVASQSERQFGAFVFTYLLVNGKPPDLETEDYRRFRNDVLHKGKIPSREKVLEFGDCVKNTIENLIIELWRFDRDAVNEVMNVFLDDAAKRSKEKGYPQYTSVATTLIIGKSEDEVSNYGRPCLEEHLKRIDFVRQRELERQRIASPA